MISLLLIATVIILILGWCVFAKDEALTDAKASLASQKVLTDLTQRDADRYLKFYELECAGREQDGFEARVKISRLEHELAVRRLAGRQQVERINFLTRRKRDLDNSFELAARRVSQEVERANALSEQCNHTARKLQEYRDTVAELLHYNAARSGSFTAKHPRLVKIIRAIDDVYNDRI